MPPTDPNGPTLPPVPPGGGTIGYAAPATDAAPPAAVPGYELLHELARGGMGVVYKARDLRLDRVVALKMVLAGAFASAEGLRRFRQEAEAAAGLDHPNIVPVYEVGECDGRPYFTMKLIGGGSLADRLTGPARGDDLRGLVGQLAAVARAVHFSHQRGVLHRDLKPTNVLLGPDGTPYVADFGLAKRVEGDGGLTASGAILGTPSYMAPEQARADRTLTTAVDVYALGALLYEALAGRPPFRAATPLDTVLQVLERDPPRPSATDPAVDRDLETVALKCLDKEPARRYESAAAVADELERVLRGEPVVARPRGAGDRAWRWVKKRPAVAGLAAALVATLVGGTAVAFALYLRAESQRADAVAQRQAAEDQLWQATFERARAERLAGNRAAALALLGAAGRTRQPLELRAEAGRAATAFGLRLVSKTGGRRATSRGGEGPYVLWAGDGSLVAVEDLVPEGRDNRHGLRAFDPVSGRTVAVLTFGDDPDRFAAGHPTKPQYAVVRAGRVVLWEPRTGRVTDLGPGREAVAFDAAGTRLAVRRGREVTVYDLAGGPEATVPTWHQPVGFAADGQLIVRDADARLHRWDVAAARETAATPEGYAASTRDAEGRFVVLTRGDKPTVVWDLPAGRPHGELPDTIWTSNASARAFSPTEPLIAYPAKTPGTVLLFDLAAGAVRERLVAASRGNHNQMYAQFRPGGGVLAADAANDNELRLWEVATGRLLATLPLHGQAAWSPDGRFLAAGCDQGWVETEEGGGATRSHLRIYEVPPLPARARSPIPVRRVSWSADGRRLAAGGAVWQFASAPFPALLRPEPTADRRSTFFAAGRRWTFPLNELLRPGLATTLDCPDEPARSAAFPGRPDHGWPHSPNAGSITDLALFPDGQRALVSWKGFAKPAGPTETSRTPAARLELWDLAGPRLTGVWAEGQEVAALAVSPDGHRVASGGNLGFAVWDAATGRRLTPERGGQPLAVAFRPDGRTVLAGYRRGEVAVLDADSGTDVIRWTAHEGDVAAVAVSPDGQSFATGSEDGEVVVWDAAARRERTRWSAGTSGVVALAFSPDGAFLAAADEKGLVQVWHLPAIQATLERVGLTW